MSEIKPNIKNTLRPKVKFCGICGNELTNKSIHGIKRSDCITCGHIVFLDPKLAVVVLVAKDNELLLVKRAIEPSIGKWSFPSGYVDRGEIVEAAAIREVKEETGLNIQILDLIGVYSKKNNPIVLVVYSAKIVGGKIEAGKECEEVAFFSTDNLPKMPFPHDEQILSDWGNLSKSNF